MKTNITSIPIYQLKDNILIVKVGNEDRPAGPDDITQVRNELTKILKDFEGCRVLVIHHAIDFQLLSTKGLKNIPKLMEKLRKKSSERMGSRNAIFSLEV